MCKSINIRVFVHCIFSISQVAGKKVRFRQKIFPLIAANIVILDIVDRSDDQIKGMIIDDFPVPGNISFPVVASEFDSEQRQAAYFLK